MSINENNRIGNNIRSLREAYGEKPEDLANIIGVVVKAVNNYELGKREVDNQKKELIAKHYMVSVQELMFSDLSSYDLHINAEIINGALNSIHFLYPIIETEHALANTFFVKAYNYHKSLYDLLKNVNIQQLLDNTSHESKIVDTELNIIFKLFQDNWSDYLDCYCSAYSYDKIKIESAVNYVAMYHIFFGIISVSKLLLDKPAIINYLKELIPAMSQISDFLKNQSIEELQDIIQSAFPISQNHEVYKSQLNVMMTTIHKNQDYSDLAYYYDAMEYVYNLVDNGSDFATNKKTGYDMLKQFAKYGNIYAQRYLKYNPDPKG